MNKNSNNKQQKIETQSNCLLDLYIDAYYQTPCTARIFCARKPFANNFHGGRLSGTYNEAHTTLQRHQQIQYKEATGKRQGDEDAAQTDLVN